MLYESAEGRTIAGDGFPQKSPVDKLREEAFIDCRKHDCSDPNLPSDTPVDRKPPILDNPPTEEKTSIPYDGHLKEDIRNIEATIKVQKDFGDGFERERMENFLRRCDKQGLLNWALSEINNEIKKTNPELSLSWHTKTTGTHEFNATRTISIFLIDHAKSMDSDLYLEDKLRFKSYVSDFVKPTRTQSS